MKKEYNWCGPNKWKFRPPCFTFNRACFLHDKAYRYARQSRHKIDRRFLKEMLLSTRSTGWRRLYLVPMAFLYYVFALIMGWKYYGK